MFYESWHKGRLRNPSRRLCGDHRAVWVRRTLWTPINSGGDVFSLNSQDTKNAEVTRDKVLTDQ